MVESAAALGEEARALLRDALGREPEARTVAELGIGVRVTTEAGQVDASALGIARAAAHELEARLGPERLEPEPDGRTARVG